MRLSRFLFALSLLFPVAAHAALPCSAYPNTLTNGTLADANQVMANFNNILNCVNSLAPLATPVIGQSSNVKASEASASASITVTADSITVGTALNGTSYTLTSYSQAFNGATTGAGGMDIGTLPTSSFVALYAIYNPTSPATSILGTSCATSCPTIYAGGSLPAGYTASALLTTLPTNATPQIPAGTYVRGKQVSIIDVTGTTQSVNKSITQLSIATIVPPNATTVSGLMVNGCGGSPGAAQVATNVYSDVNSSGSQGIGGNCASTNTVVAGVFSNVPMPTAQNIWYTTTVAGTSPSSSINIGGYTIP